MLLLINLRNGGLLRIITHCALLGASGIDCVRSRREGILVARPNPVQRSRLS